MRKAIVVVVLVGGLAAASSPGQEPLFVTDCKLTCGAATLKVWVTTNLGFTQLVTSRFVVDVKCLPGSSTPPWCQATYSLFLQKWDTVAGDWVNQLSKQTPTIPYSCNSEQTEDTGDWGWGPWPAGKYQMVAYVGWAGHGEIVLTRYYQFTVTRNRI
jgi:hypothetical protein